MSTIRNRLRALERATGVGSGTCTACRDRQGRTVLTSATQLPDGTVVPEGDQPQPCATCGQVPELVIRIVETVVEGVAYKAPPP